MSSVKLALLGYKGAPTDLISASRPLDTGRFTQHASIVCLDQITGTHRLTSVCLGMRIIAGLPQSTTASYSAAEHISGEPNGITDQRALVVE